MKIKERIRPLLNALQITVGCIIALLAGSLAGTCVICAFAALLGGLELDSFGEQSGYFLLYFVLAAIFFYAMVWGRRIKNGSPENNRQNLWCKRCLSLTLPSLRKIRSGWKKSNRVSILW